MRHASSHVTTATDHCHLEGIDSQTRLHPRADRVANDARRAGVLDCAQVQLALIGVVLRDVGEPELIRAIGSELMTGSSVGVDNHAQVVVDGWSWTLAVLGPGLTEGREPRVVRAQPPRGAHCHRLTGNLGL